MAHPNEQRLTLLARTNWRDIRKPFGIRQADRRSHMYVVGKTGTGKSTLLETMIRQDVVNGQGLAVLVFSTVEPIVSEDLWTRANALLAGQRQDGKRMAKKPVQLFAGVAYCFCGQKMYVPTGTPKYVCYKSRNKIPVTDVEGVFHEQLKQFVFSPTEIAGYLEQADHTIKERAEQLAALERELDTVKQEQDRVYRAYVKDELPMEPFGRQYRPLEERRQQLEAEIPRRQGELDFLKIQ